ncbi:chloride channel protein [Marinithermus hydrothermalis]|nr:chloride channel protein [Marinithermus hydrothermalis]
MSASQVRLLLLLGVLPGLMSGFVTVAFTLALEWVTNAFAYIGPPLAPALGGLAVGLILLYAPETAGAGINKVVEAYHRTAGRLRRRITWAKPLTSVISLGSGGSGGQEGPLVQSGAALGSLLADILRLSEGERRVMVLSGAAGAIGAVFQAPLGGAFFVSEVLYRRLEFETEALMGAILSAITAYAVYGSFFGFHPLFTVSISGEMHPWTLPAYALLGAVEAGAAIAFIALFRFVQGRLEALRLPLWTKPALGGAVVGLIGMGVPGALGVGYGELLRVLETTPPLSWVLLLILAKLLTTSFTIGSGGSAGLFGPSVFIGGMVGIGVGRLAGRVFPGLEGMEAEFMMVGMAAFFASAAKTPLASIIQVIEMSGTYALLVPGLLAGTVSYALSGPRWTLFPAQVPSRADSPVHVGTYLQVGLERLRKAQLTQDLKLEGIPLPDLADLLQLGRPVPLDPHERRFFYTLTLPEGTALAGKALRNAGLPTDILITAVLRRDQVIVPHGDTVLQPGDRLIVISTPEAMTAFREWLEAPVEPRGEA